MATEEQGTGVAFEGVKSVDEKYWTSNKFQGLTFDEINIACGNIGIDLQCGGCASIFYTGHEDIHDDNCTLRGGKTFEELFISHHLSSYQVVDPGIKQSLFDLLQESRKQFPTLKTHVATVIVESGPTRVTYSVSISRGEA